MRVRDLGPLLLADDHGREQPVVGTKGSAMLALLTIHVNQQVSVDALTEAAWGEHVSAGAASTLLSHVWRLRQLLEPDRRSGTAPTVLLNDAGGYRLVGSPASVDSLFFAESAARVRDHLASGRLDEALVGADAALARWRGRPYGPAADAGWAQPAVARLEELRAQLQERRISALVGLGALDTALSDLQPLIAAMPFHEALRGLQMEALHRSGRTEQALEAFAGARRTLVDEVGIEPGRDLQELHRRILDDDPSLTGPRTVSATPPLTAPVAPLPSQDEPPPTPVGVHLPPTPTVLLGREVELGRLRTLVSEHRLVTVSGPAGCGKTRLAVEVARSVADDFPDGLWFVDLVGVGDPELIVDVITSTIGFVPSADATPLEDLVSYLRSRTLLLVLDNCEHLLTAAAALVEQVLGDPSAAAGSRILATSRERLGVPGEVGWTLEPLGLPEAGSADPGGAAAVQLLVDRLRAADPTLEVDGPAMSEVLRICVALDGLPLPLELAAARAPTFSLAEIAEQVSTEPGRLRRPGRAGHDHRSTLRSTIDWSYRLLGEREQAAHRRLSVLPGPFSEAAAAAVLGVGAEEAEETLVELVHRSMLARVGAAHVGRPTTFRQLVTVRDHAARDLRQADSPAEAEDRRDAFTLALVAERPPLGTVTEPRWFDALDDDQAAVRATLTRLLVERPSSTGARLAASLGFYWYHRGRLAEATRWLTVASTAVSEAGPRDLAFVRVTLAAILTLQGRHPHARALVDQVDPASFDPRDEALTEAVVGLAGAAYISGSYPLVVEMQRHLPALVDDATSPHLRLLARAVEALALAVGRRFAEALAVAEPVHERAVAQGVPMAAWMAAGGPMALGLLTGEPEIGVVWAERCMAAHFPFGTGAGGAFIETRANLATQLGDDALAARLYGAAYHTTRRVGMRWPFRDLTLELIEQARTRLGRSQFDRLWAAGQPLSPLQVLAGLETGFHG